MNIKPNKNLENKLNYPTSSEAATVSVQDSKLNIEVDQSSDQNSPIIANGISVKDFWATDAKIHKLQLGMLDDILGVVGAPLDEQMKKRKEATLNSKLAIVKKVHVGKRGNPLAISQIQKSGESYYFTKLDGKSVFCKTYEGMIDKLYIHYGGDALLHNHSIAYYFEQYMKEYIEMNPGNEKTIRNTKADYKRFVDSDLAQMDVRDITPKYLDIYSRKMIVQLKLKVSAFKNFKSLLNNIFSTAISNMVIYQNPAKAMNNKACYALCDQSLRSELDYDEKLISEEEMEQIEEEADRRREYHKRYGNDAFYFYDIMIKFHAEIGCRPSELCALKLRDVKTDDLHIHAMIDADGDYQQFTKNEKGESRGGRLFPLTPKALDLIEELNLRKEKAGIDSDFLFCQKDGRFVLPDAYEEFVRNVFKTIKLRDKSCYAFRRTVNNRLEEAEFTPSERAYLLGHSPDTNLKHYTNPRKQSTLTKFKDTFCTRSTFSPPKNVIDFPIRKAREPHILRLS